MSEGKNSKIRLWLLFATMTALVVGTHLVAYPHHGLNQLKAIFLGRTVAAVPARDCSGDTATQEIKVEITDKGFVASQLTANICDRLTFTNVGRKDHEPAVGPHPSHDAYPEFDAKKPLQPGETFSFVLTRPGEYSFHDHLHIGLIGKIAIVE